MDDTAIPKRWILFVFEKRLFGFGILFVAQIRVMLLTNVAASSSLCLSENDSGTVKNYPDAIDEVDLWLRLKGKRQNLFWMLSLRWRLGIGDIQVLRSRWPAERQITNSSRLNMCRPKSIFCQHSAPMGLRRIREALF